MGYDLHITRRNDWVDTDGPEISEAEWHKVARADPELEVGGQVTWQLPDGTTHDVDLYGWKKHPSGLFPPFVWHRGEITVKDPDEPTIGKMVDIARKLNANVQGDDGELYDESFVASHRSSKNTPQRRTPIWWQKLLGKG